MNDTAIKHKYVGLVHIYDIRNIKFYMDVGECTIILMFIPQHAHVNICAKNIKTMYLHTFMCGRQVKSRNSEWLRR